MITIKTPPTEEEYHIIILHLANAIMYLRIAMSMNKKLKKIIINCLLEKRKDDAT